MVKSREIHGISTFLLGPLMGCWILEGDGISQNMSRLRCPQPPRIVAPLMASRKFHVGTCLRWASAALCPDAVSCTKAPNKWQTPRHHQAFVCEEITMAASGIMSQCLEAAQSPTLRCSAFHLQFQLALCCTSLRLPRFTAYSVGHVALGQNLVPQISDASIIYFIHLRTNSCLNIAKICDPPFQSLGL